MNKKGIFRVLAIVILMVLSMSLFSPALAASKTYKGVKNQTYTVKTGKKDSKLTLTNKSGKQTIVYKKNSNGKIKKKSANLRGAFSVTISDGSKEVTKTLNYPFNSKQTYTLKRNSTYTITVSYDGYSDEICITPAGYHEDSRSWKTNPSVKIDVNNSAKISMK